MLRPMLSHPFLINKRMRPMWIAPLIMDDVRHWPGFSFLLAPAAPRIPSDLQPCYDSCGKSVDRFAGCCMRIKLCCGDRFVNQQSVTISFSNGTTTITRFKCVLLSVATDFEPGKFLPWRMGGGAGQRLDEADEDVRLLQLKFISLKLDLEI